MSRNLDMENLSPNDIEYIRQRPLLHQEILRRGYPDPLDEDFEIPGEDNDEGVNEETQRLFSDDPDEIEFLSDEEKEDLEEIDALDDDESGEGSKDRDPEDGSDNDAEGEEENSSDDSSTEEGEEENSSDDLEDPDDDGEEGEDETESAPEPTDYSEWNKQELKAEIDDRNSDRDPGGENYISPAGKNKGDLIAALEADDAS